MARKRVKRKIKSKKVTNVTSMILTGVIGALGIVIVMFLYSLYDGHLRVEANMAAYSGDDLENIPTAILTAQEDIQKEVNIVLQILNGCGVSGVSKKYKSLLNDKGLDIINTDNADNFDYSNSLIYFHAGNIDKAFQLAGILGIEKNMIFERPIMGVNSDLTLVLGHDYDQLGDFYFENPEVTIQILNGCGVSGISKRYKDYFTKQGYRVVDVDNADHFNYSHTEIQYKNLSAANLDELSGLLGLGTDQIQKRSRFTKADVSIILGSDYEDLKPYRNLEVR